MNRNYGLSISLIFFSFLLTVPIYWFFFPGGGNKFSNEENRSLTVFPSLGFKTAAKRFLRGEIESARQIQIPMAQFLNRSFQKNVENASNDQFPFRIQLTQIGRFVERGLIWLSYSVISDPAVPASVSTPVFVLRDGSIILNTPSIFNDQVKQNIDKRINNYQELVNRYPNQHFYIFYLELIQNSKYHPMNPYFSNADNGHSFEYFENNLPKGIGLSKLMLSSYQDYMENFFHTDHHWNIHGAWKGYEDIYKMLAPHYPEIGPQLALQGTYSLPGVEYLGSLARLTLYPISPETFEVADVEMPTYKLYISSNEQPEETLTDFLPEKYNYTRDIKYFNYYTLFYGHDTDIREYSFNNKARRNLLVLSNSFGSSMIKYVAAHYRHTYQVDLRHYKKFSMKEFIKRYKIDDVLVLGDSSMVYQEDSWINP